MTSSDGDSDSSVWETEMFCAIYKKQVKGRKVSEQDKIRQIRDCLDQGVNINALGKNGDTILHIAVKKGYQEVVQFLRRNGAGTDICNERGCTAITLTEDLSDQGIASILKEPIEQRSEQGIHPKNEFLVLDDEKPSTSRDGNFRNGNSLPTRIFDERDTKFGPVTQTLKRKADDSDSECDKSGKEQHLDVNFEGNTKSRVRPQRYHHKTTYAASGLKLSLHGIVYQLKHIMLVVNRVWKKGYSFCLSTEMNAAEKFDDLVLEYEDSTGNEVRRFVQMKHKEDESKMINVRQLLDVNDGDFSLLKYFVSWRKIKSHSEFSGSGSKRFILCTNVDLDVQGLKLADINVSEVSEPDEFLKVTNRTKQPPRYKLLVKKSSDLWDTLKSASDVHRLANALAKRVHESKEIDLKTGIFRYYHIALAQEVVDIGTKKLSHHFVKNKNLSGKAEKFRETFFLHAKQFSQRKTSEKDIWEGMQKRVLKLSSTFGKKFEPAAHPQLTDVQQFSQEFFRLLNKATSDNAVKIDRQKQATNLSAERIFSDNIDKLAGHVLITDAGKIKFRQQFLDDNVRLSGNLEELRTALKTKLVSKFDELNKFEFDINNFRTYTEEGLSSNTELPDDDIDDGEIKDFLDEFVLAVKQPNEVELGEMIRSEIGAYSQFNLLKAGFIKDSFQNVILDWFKKTGKFSAFLKNKDAEAFFSSMESELSSLITVGVNLPYPAELKKFGIKFNRKNNDLENFFDNNRAPILELISSRQTFLTALRVYQTIEEIGRHKENDSYIFIHLEKLLLPEIESQVLCAFQLPRSHDLLVIDCESIGKKQDTYGYRYRLWNRLCEIMRKNVSKRMILIIQGNTDSVIQFGIDYETCYEKAEDISIDNLKENSRRELLQKKVIKFQGQKERTSIGTLLGIHNFDDTGTNELQDLKRIIDPNTLIRLIRNEEVQVGGELRGLGDIQGYYIPRTIVRRVVIIKETILKAPQILDLFAISGISREALETLVLAKDMKKKFDEGNQTECRLNEYVILDIGGEEEQLETQRKRYPNRNIHWLDGSSGELIWKQSFGDITNLVEYENEGKVQDYNDRPGTTYLTEKQLLDHDEQHRTVILSDVAGMGKSTILTELGGIIKRNKSSTLVVRVDLTQHSIVLAKQRENKTFDRNDVEGAVDFLVDEILSLGSNFESETFRTIIKVGGEAVLLFDGFDEISPKYEDTVIELLRALAKCQIKRMFITTRPHTRKSLEKNMEIFSYMMQPFSEANQIDFLTRFWKKGLSRIDNPVEKTEELLKSHAKTVIDILANSINHQMKEFTGVPLQTRLVAEVYEYGNKENLPKSMDVIDLYRKFVDKKYEIFFSEKKPSDQTNLAEELTRKFTRKIFLMRHQKSSLDALFDEETVAVLLNSQSEVGRWCASFWDKNEAAERTGIITQVTNGKPEFIHRTFAEYFAAIFLRNTLHGSSEDYRLRKFFVAQLFVEPEYKTIRAFVNCLFSGKRAALNNESWEFDLRDNCNARNKTVYHVAAKERNAEIVKFFNKRLRRSNMDGTLNEVKDSPKGEANIDLRDWKGRTAVLVAVLTNDTFDVVKCLVEGGANIEITDNMKSTPLHKAAILGKLDLVKYFLKNGAAVDSKDVSNWTPLHTAASESGTLDVVKYLLNKGADINQKTDDEWTPLHLAALKTGNLRLIEFLHENGLSIHSKAQNGETPLHIAVLVGDFGMVNYLVEKGASINCQDKSGFSLLHMAASKANNLDIVKYLHEKGAVINSLNSDDLTPLHLAAETGSLDVVEYLVEKDVDIDCRDQFGLTPLHKAAPQTRKLHVVKYLLDKGANIDCKDEYGQTPLHMGASRASNLLLGVVKCLIEKGADLNPRNDDHQTPLHLAAESKNFDVVEYLVEKGADIGCRDDGGFTPLHRAVLQAGNLDVVKYLHEKSIDINFETEDGWTPLLLAAESGGLEVVKYLVDKGADINHRNKNRYTPLHEVASKSGNLNVLKYLLNKGADIHCKDEHGQTPLHRAASKLANLDMIEYLHEQGLDVQSRTKCGWTPLHLAAEFNGLDVVKYLVEKGADIDSQDEDGWTPLHRAASRNDNFNGANFSNENSDIVHYQRSRITTPPCEVNELGKLNIVKYLLDKGADIDCQSRLRHTPLHTAVDFDNWEVVRLLVDRRADVNIKNQSGLTPQSLATLKNSDLEIVRNSFGNLTDVESSEDGGSASLRQS